MFTRDVLVDLFNQWMDRFIENPEQFSGQWASVRDHLTEIKTGKEPSYGETMVAYFERLQHEMAAEVDGVKTPGVAPADRGDPELDPAAAEEESDPAAGLI